MLERVREESIRDLFDGDTSTSTAFYDRLDVVLSQVNVDVTPHLLLTYALTPGTIFQLIKYVPDVVENLLPIVKNAMDSGHNEKHVLNTLEFFRPVLNTTISVPQFLYEMKQLIGYDPTGIEIKFLVYALGSYQHYLHAN